MYIVRLCVVLSSGFDDFLGEIAALDGCRVLLLFGSMILLLAWLPLLSYGM